MHLFGGWCLKFHDDIEKFPNFTVAESASKDAQCPRCTPSSSSSSPFFLQYINVSQMSSMCGVQLFRNTFILTFQVSHYQTYKGLLETSVWVCE